MNNIALPTDVREAVLLRDQYRCRGCGWTRRDGGERRIEVDHIIPRSRDGSNDLSNLQALCNRCNASKGAQTMDEWTSPLETPPIAAPVHPVMSRWVRRGCECEHCEAYRQRMSG